MVICTGWQAQLGLGCLVREMLAGSDGRVTCIAMAVSLSMIGSSAPGQTSPMSLISRKQGKVGGVSVRRRWLSALGLGFGLGLGRAASAHHQCAFEKKLSSVVYSLAAPAKNDCSPGLGAAGKPPRGRHQGREVSWALRAAISARRHAVVEHARRSGWSISLG